MGVLIFNPAHSQETMAQFRESLRADNRHKELMKSMKQQDINSTKSRQQYIDTMHSELESTRKTIGKQTLDIIASNEAIEDAIDNGFEMVNNSLHNIGNSIESFHSDFRIGIGELIQQQRITNLLLENVSELLKIPDSEKERYNYLENGLKHYKNGLFKDSLNNLLYVEKIRTEKIGNEDNYFVLYNIGLIYLLQYDLFNAEVALKYFEQAAKYAEVETKESSAKLLRILEGKTTQDFDSGNVKKLASESYFYAAFASYLLGDFTKSINHCNKAIEINPLFAEAVFLKSKSLSANNNIELALKNLDNLLRRLPNYSIKVSCDGDLYPKKEVKDFLINLRDEFLQKTAELLNTFTNKLSMINDKYDNFSTDELKRKYILSMNTELFEILNLLKRKSYLDSLKAIELMKTYKIETKLWEFEKNKDDVFELNNNIIDFENEYKNWKSFTKDEIDLIDEKMGIIKEIINSDFIKTQNKFNKMFTDVSAYINDKKTNFVYEKKNEISEGFNKKISVLRGKEKTTEKIIEFYDGYPYAGRGCLLWIGLTIVFFFICAFNLIDTANTLFTLFAFPPIITIFTTLMLFVIKIINEVSNSIIKNNIEKIQKARDIKVENIKYSKIIEENIFKLDYVSSLKKKYYIDCH